MLSQLLRSERHRLEWEVEILLQRLGRYQGDPNQIENLAREIDRDLVLADAERQRCWASLLRRRAMCIRTARVATYRRPYPV